MLRFNTKGLCSVCGSHSCSRRMKILRLKGNHFFFFIFRSPTSPWEWQMILFVWCKYKRSTDWCLPTDFEQAQAVSPSLFFVLNFNVFCRRRRKVMGEWWTNANKKKLIYIVHTLSVTAIFYTCIFSLRLCMQMYVAWGRFFDALFRVHFSLHVMYKIKI